jgi:hypothetical protein
MERMSKEETTQVELTASAAASPTLLYTASSTCQLPCLDRGSTLFAIDSLTI